MPVKELVEKYGGKPNVALRRAVRAEIPGGADLFDALQIAARNRAESDDWRRLHNALIRTREAIFKDVARKYGFKSAVEPTLGATVKNDNPDETNETDRTKGNAER